MSNAGVRKAWFTAHKWIGLGIGLLLSLQGLTGSVNVFNREIEFWATPSRWEVSSAGPARALSDLARAGAARCDRSEADTVRLEFPEASDRALEVLCAIAGVKYITTVDPRSGSVLASWPENSMATRLIYEWHSTLLLGAMGGYVLLGLSLCLLAMALSGFYLWWPRGRLSAKSFVIRRGARGRQLWFELHRTVGFYASPLLALLSLTGLYLAAPALFGGAVASVAPVHSIVGYAEPNLDIADANTRVDAGRAVAIVMAAYPRAVISEVQLPVAIRRPILVVFRQPGEWIRHGGESVAWLHPQTGEILRTYDSARGGGAGDHFLAALFPLHAGHAFGIVHRWLICLAGLAPSLLLVTGFMLWRGRHSKQARALK